MNIGIDIDDTLVETTKNLERDILNYEGGEEVIEHIEEVMSGKIPTENIKKFMNTYLTTRLEGLEIKTNAVEVINKLKSDGHKIIFITSRGEESGKGATEITLKYLENNKVPYDNIIFSATDKAKACIENNIDIMIDDSIKHCEDVEKTGIKAILFTSMINKDKNASLQRANNWKELEEKINEFSRKQNI